jgi:hypothetical protein
MQRNYGVVIERYKKIIEKNVILMKLIQIGEIKNVALLVN